MTPGRVLLTAAAVALLTGGCAAVVDGQGSISGAPDPTSSSVPAPCSPSSGASAAPQCLPSSPSSPSTTSASSASSSSGATVPERFARVAPDTELGDPVTADFCAAAGLPRVAGLVASYPSVQYHDGCLLQFARAGTSGHVTLRVSASTEAPITSAARRTTVAGHTVFARRYSAASHACDRDAVVRGATVSFQVIALGAVKPDEKAACAISDQAVGNLLRAVAAGRLQRVPSPTPSVTSLNACKVAAAADVSSVPLLRSARPSAESFDAGCVLTGKRVIAYVDPEYSKRTVPEGAHVEAAGSHRVYADDDNGTYSCDFTAVQGSSGGVTESVSFGSFPNGSASSVPDPSCADTLSAFGRYLDAAGLR
ncbi:hypothetical protein SAMN05443575_2354 [Jatrophihabitans endophyticus]|uniref:DUF3558 domain-containing protein n=1 Tax=Jatrophihabitans endophyticus TaxID=1206085 RepID=A0A1M5L582_9ACTN|nr:hypothetical protein [Jatrophihabitans endophyticus]SHG60095.1 hypothetical protein SAMN05443575_2354 [Jatrophihabitans endophyticus]